MPEHKRLTGVSKMILRRPGKYRQSRSKMVIFPVSFYMQAEHAADSQRLVIFLQGCTASGFLDTSFY